MLEVGRVLSQHVRATPRSCAPVKRISGTSIVQESEQLYQTTALHEGAMLSIKTQSNLGNAERYFKEHLQHGDYYNQRGAVPGQWMGSAAERLGLSGIVRQEDFLALCHNQNPHTGTTLTQRLKTTRQEIGEDGRMRQVANRRI